MIRDIIYSEEKHDQILPLLTDRYTSLYTRRLQPLRDDCAVRLQWFSSVKTCPLWKIVTKVIFQGLGIMVHSYMQSLTSLSAISFKM